MVRASQGTCLVHHAAVWQCICPHSHDEIEMCSLTWCLLAVVSTQRQVPWCGDQMSSLSRIVPKSGKTPAYTQRSEDERGCPPAGVYCHLSQPGLLKAIPPGHESPHTFPLGCLTPTPCMSGGILVQVLPDQIRRDINWAATWVMTSLWCIRRHMPGSSAFE